MTDLENKTTETASAQEGAEDVFAKTPPAKIPAKSRIWELDFLRGLCVLLMVFDHIMYDFAYIFGNRGGLWYDSAGYAGSAAERIAVFALSFWGSPARDAVQPLIAGMFVFLSGISSGLSKSNLKRGLRVIVFALLLTAATSIFNEFIKGTLIRFGVLHMLGVSMLLFGAVEFALRYFKADEKFKYTNLIVYTVIGFLLLFLGMPYFKTPLPEGNGLTFYLVYTKGFYSADYFPVLPWSGLMFLGAVFGKLIYSHKKSLFGGANDKLLRVTAPVNAVGKSAIWVYLLHQIIAFMLLYLMGLLAGFGGM